MGAILFICFIFVALLPTTIAMSVFTYQRRNKLWARIWTVLAILGGLAIIVLPALSILSGGPHSHHETSLGMYIVGVFVSMAWMAQLVVIGILALARSVTKHVSRGAVVPSETPDDSLAAPAARREEAPPRWGFSWILWIGIAVIACFLLAPISSLLWVCSGAFIVIGIAVLALRATKHISGAAVAPSEYPDNSMAASAARREEALPRRGFLWILWTGIAVIAFFVFTPASDLLEFWFEAPITPLRWFMHVVCTTLLPLALAFIITGHRWKAHVWAAFWYIVAVPGAIGLVIRLFPSLVQSGSLLQDFRPGYYEDWARIYPAIFVLAAVCCVVALRLWLAKANPMWRWAFTWATIGYVFLAHP